MIPERDPIICIYGLKNNVKKCFIDLMAFVDFPTEMWYNADELHIVKNIKKHRAL